MCLDLNIMLQRSGLSKERVTIGTGIPDLERLGEVSSYDGDTELQHWDTQLCNSITGSDGTVFPGNVVKNSNRVYIYVRNFCRRIPLDFNGEYVVSKTLIQ